MYGGLGYLRGAEQLASTMQATTITRPQCGSEAQEASAMKYIKRSPSRIVDATRIWRRRREPEIQSDRSREAWPHSQGSFEQLASQVQTHGARTWRRSSSESACGRNYESDMRYEIGGRRQ